MRILHSFLILAFPILLKYVHCCDSSTNPLLLPSSPQKDSPFTVPASNTELSVVSTFILAVTWPLGACTGNSGITCLINPVPTEFKIHGLWPNPNGVPTEEYDPNKLTSITSELNTYWPNLKSKQQQISVNLDFWRHEWIDHGKYSEMGVLAYFKKSLELFKDVGQGLKAKLVAEKITPTLYKTYKLEAIEAALKKINGGYFVTIVCNERKTTKKEKQIQEVRFKFTKDFQKQNNVASSTCGSATSDIMFPAAN